MTYSARAELKKASLPSADKIALAFCSTTILYMMVFGISRYYAIEAMVAFSMLACIGLAFARRIHFGTRIVWFFIVSVSYLLLSFEDALPRAWTVYWDAEIAVRQWSWVILVPLFTASTAYVFIVAKEHIVENSFRYFIVSLVITRLSLIFSPYDKEMNIYDLITIYTFVSENLLVQFFLSVFLIYKVKVNSISLLAFLVFSAYFSSAQSFIGYLLIYAIWITGKGRWAIAAISVGMAALLLAAPFYVGFLYDLDSNTGFRALLWRDAIYAFTESHGLGVGYGTEYITNDFSGFRDRGWVITGESSDDRLLIGTHSTFYDILMRTGVAGVATFGFWFADMVRRSLSGVGADGKMNASVGSLLIIINAANMGVTAVSFMLSTCLCCGWLLANTISTKPIARGRAARSGRMLHA